MRDHGGVILGTTLSRRLEGRTRLGTMALEAGVVQLMGTVALEGARYASAPARSAPPGRRRRWWTPSSRARALKRERGSSAASARAARRPSDVASAGSIASDEASFITGVAFASTAAISPVADPHEAIVMIDCPSPGLSARSVSPFITTR